MADDVTVDNGGLADYTVAADEIAGTPTQLVQIIKLAYSANGVRTLVDADAEGLLVRPFRSAASVNGNETTTGTSSSDGPTTDYMTGFHLYVVGTGAAADAWTVSLQGSIDGTNWFTILQHADATDADGDVVFCGPGPFAKYVRYVVDDVTLGSATDIFVEAIGSVL